MTKLKYVDELNNFLDKWLYELGFDCTCDLGTDFLYFPYEEKINYAFVVDDDHDKLFAKYCDSLGLKYECDNFILSFFHELGHYMTYDDISQRVENRCDKAKEVLANKSNLSNKDYWKYYNLPDERIATQWAVDFINDNANLINDFWDRFRPLIMKFYKLNGVEI